MKTYTKYFNAHCLHALPVCPVRILREEVAPNVDYYFVAASNILLHFYIFNIIPSERQDPIIRQDIINGRDECEPAP
jgi:hypothetical protein